MEGSLKPKTASELFQEALPVYLSMGMTYNEFFYKESWLVKSFRKAYRIKQDEINHSAWLQGLYIVQALNSGVPVVLNGIMKQVQELPNYPGKPLEFNEKDEKKIEQNRMELQVAKMKEMMEQFNSTFARKQKKE